CNRPDGTQSRAPEPGIHASAPAASARAPQFKPSCSCPRHLLSAIWKSSSIEGARNASRAGYPRLCLPDESVQASKRAEPDRAESAVLTDGPDMNHRPRAHSREACDSIAWQVYSAYPRIYELR